MTAKTPVRWGEMIFYAFTIALAAGPLDRLVNQIPPFQYVRAAGWAVVYGGFGLAVLRQPRRLGQAVAAAWPLFLMAGMALLSLLWSQAPQQTLVGALQMTATMIFGALMGRRLTEGQILGLMVVVIGAITIPDLAVVLGSPMGLDINGDAVGLFSHKNQQGQMMAALVLAALSLTAWDRPKPVALFALGMGLLLLALSGSRTSWLVTAVGAAAILVLFLKRLSPGGRITIFCIGLAGACGLAALWISADLDLTSKALEAVGKDSTLTGRTVLWDLAGGYIHRAPLLGQGFNGFWSEDVTSDAAFVNSVLMEDLASFHNGYLEMAVELGWLGTALEVAVMAAFLGPVRRLLKSGQPAAAAFAVGLLVLAAMGNLSEVVLFVRHGFALLLMAALWSRSTMLSPQLSRNESPPLQFAEHIAAVNSPNGGIPPAEPLAQALLDRPRTS